VVVRRRGGGSGCERGAGNQDPIRSHGLLEAAITGNIGGKNGGEPTLYRGLFVPYGSEEALVKGLKAGEQLAQLILVKR
jgi:hypothetical protein